MIFSAANSFVYNILPVSPLNSKILAAYRTYLVDSIRPRGEGYPGDEEVKK
jgi:hypothetical protein